MSPSELVNYLNETYLNLHIAKEDAFWGEKMALKAYRQGEFEEKENRLRAYISDPSVLPKVREALLDTSVSGDTRVALEGWRHFFEVNAVESEEAKRLQAKLVEMEGELERKRRDMRLGYTDPEMGTFVEGGSDLLRLVVSTSPSEASRKAAWDGLCTIGPFVLSEGFLEIVKERNRLGRLLGYEDYYDYRVQLNEGFPKKKLFEILGELERETRPQCERSVSNLEKTSGPGAREPWNFEQLISGDLTTLTDPYMGFESAFGRWGRSFAALGITYRNATLTLDLVTRKGKEENGFMHGPFPAFFDKGVFRPARINFTSNAIPGQVGAGQKALATLFHEGGHAAHFSNILMPAPCFSQEFAPSSVAFAETQSMFLDSLVEDPDWLARYAINARGQAMPAALIREGMVKEQAILAYRLRSMLVVPFAEKMIYELSDSELTPETVQKRVREVERDIVRLNAAVRPVLAVPHLLSGEASAYYHGYVLAQMAVYQTRAYFKTKHGHITDNPDVGGEMEKKYWAPGNAKTFLDLVQDLTGEPFSAAASIAEVSKSIADVSDEAQAAVEEEPRIPRYAGPVQLDAVIRLVHGDDVIASNESGETFEAMEEKYGDWIKSLG